MVPKDFGLPQKHFTPICHFCKTIQQFMKESTFNSFKGFFFFIVHFFVTWMHLRNIGFNPGERLVFVGEKRMQMVGNPRRSFRSSAYIIQY